METLRFDKRCNFSLLAQELAAASSLFEDRGADRHSLFTISETETETGVEVSLWIEDEVALAEAKREVEAAIEAHDPDAPQPPPPPSPVEELNAGIQNAKSLADVQVVFRDWSKKHKDYW